MEETIFNYTDSLLFNKVYSLTIKDEENQYNTYMVNRWCSMYSTDVASIINETVNKNWSLFLDKESHYKFLYYLLPRQQRKRITYIKKIKTAAEKKADDSLLLLQAKTAELSLREIKLYADLN